MNPLVIVCDVHGTWLTPVATQALAGVRHSGHLETLAQALALQGRTEVEDICPRDALWLQELCFAPTVVRMPWGKSNSCDLIRIVDSVAREVIAASPWRPDYVVALPDERKNSVKCFAFELEKGMRICVSLPTRLRHRQSMMAQVAHILRCPPEQRTYVSPWPSSSVKRLAVTRDWPRGALAWICPKAAMLVEQQETLRQELSISPKYFKACAALLSTIH
jgi:hypothetical protein